MRARLKDPATVHRLRWVTLAVLCVTLIVIVLDNTILNVALPTLAKAKNEGGIGAPESSLQWIVDIYTLVTAGLLLTMGSLGDRFGRYGALATGLILFGVFSALGAQATSSSQLIVFRGLMGIGGALLLPSTLSILTNVFTDPVERGRAIGVWAGVIGIGGGVGPVVGGFLLHHFWWGSVLLVNVPIVIVGLIAGYFFVPTSKDPSKPRLDPVGAALSTLGVGTLVWAVIEAPTKGWGSTPVLAAFGIAIVIIGGFLLWELRSAHPMLDVRFFRNPRFSVASGAIMLTFLGLFGMVFLLTQYLQSVRGFDPLVAGSLLLPWAALMVVMGPLSARVVERLGTKVVLSGALLIAGISVALIATFTATTPVIGIIGVTLLLGVGMANVMAPATESIMGSLPRAKAGVGSAINDTTRYVGGSIGVAILGSVLSSRYLPELRASLSGSAIPHAAAKAAEGNIQGAVEVSKSLPPAQGAHLHDVANQAFLSGLHLAVIVGAIVLVVAAAGVYRWLPARAVEEAPTGQPAEPLPATDSVELSTDSREPSLVSSAERPAAAHAMSRVVVDDVTLNGAGRVHDGFEAAECQTRSQ